MNQTKATTTKKKSAPIAATKRSSSKKLTTRKAPHAAPTVASDPEEVAAIVIEGDTHEMLMEEIPDASTAPSDANDEVNAEATTDETETDSLLEPAAEIATEREELELLTSTPLLDEAVTHFELKNSSTSGDGGEDAALRDAVDAKFLAQSDVPDDIIAPTASAEDGVNLVSATGIKVDSEVHVNPISKKAKGVDRQLRSVSPRYAQACSNVASLRHLLLAALESKVVILQKIGVDAKRIGEAVPVRNDDINAIDAEIREARKRLEGLLQRKRELKGASPELDIVNQTIRELSRKRQAARFEKTAAYKEALENKVLVEFDPLAAA